MILSDRDISLAICDGELEVSSLTVGSIFASGIVQGIVQPASIDLTLGDEFASWRDVNGAHPCYAGRIALGNDKRYPPMRVDKMHPGQVFCMPPLTFALATTAERIRFGPALCGRVEGRSSIGRLGLTVHATAGFCDPGFDGNVTLELFNMSPHVVELTPGQGICQIVVERLTSAAVKPYGHPDRHSKYQGQYSSGLVESRWDQEKS